MLSRPDLLSALVGLKEANDLDLVYSASVLDEMSTERDKPTVLATASIVENLYEGFNYELSPEFLATIDGKSEAAQAMHRKLLDAEKRSYARERLGNALRSILESNAAYNLMSPTHHHLADKLRLLARSIELS